MRKGAFYVQHNAEQHPAFRPVSQTIGKVTFQVSAFGNLNGTETAQKMMIRLLERSAAEYQLCTEKEGEGA